jgi:hypothetical protein
LPPLGNSAERPTTFQEWTGRLHDRAHTCARRDFSRAGYAPEAAAAIDAGVAEATAIGRAGRLEKRFVDGWTCPQPDLREYGDNFVFRGIVAITGLAALSPSEAMHMSPAGDGRGLFRGDGLYRLGLSRPIPADGFWSLSM